MTLRAERREVKRKKLTAKKRRGGTLAAQRARVISNRHYAGTVRKLARRKVG